MALQALATNERLYPLRQVIRCWIGRHFGNFDRIPKLGGLCRNRTGIVSCLDIRDSYGADMTQLRLIAFIAIVSQCWATTSLLAQESSSASSTTAVESLVKPWKEAIDRYHKSQEAAAVVVTRLLDTAEEKARAGGDLEKVNTIKKERTLFAEDGVVPTSIKAAAYEKSMEAAKSSLRTVAQKTKAALVKQKFDEEAAAIDQELAALVGNTGGGAPSKGQGVQTPADRRDYWRVKGSDKGDKGNEFRMVKPGEWAETVVDDIRTRYKWVEVARTPEYVELHDETRNMGARLRAGNSQLVYDYKVKGDNRFGDLYGGGWVIDSPDVVYLADLNEKVYKVWHYQGNKEFGWAKDGQMLDEGKWSPIFLENRPSPNALLMVPPAKDAALVRYDIAKLHRQFFRAKFGIADLRSTNPASAVTFVVVGDGKTLLTSKPITNWGTATACEVNIRGVKELELRVECAGDASLAYAVWYEPCLSNK